METLFTPWRYSYITGQRDGSEACFLCLAAADAGCEERLVIHVAQHHLVVLNRHPYTNGHLMVAPLAHVGTPEAASPEAQRELWPLVLRCRQLLDEEYHPDGMNLGLNLGSAAGAGVPDHFHLHLVPRWKGDTNFMSVLAATRLVPEGPLETWRRLRGRLDGGEGR